MLWWRRMGDHEGAGLMPAAAAMIAACLAAQAVTFALFAEYFATMFGTGLIPLAVHWIVPLLGATTYVLVANASRGIRIGRVLVPVGAIVLTVFTAWRVSGDLQIRRELRPVGYPGREVLRELVGRSVVTYWATSAVSAYTHEWAARLHGPRWQTVRPADVPFDPANDFYFFFEADRENPRYRTPEFLFIPAIHIGWVVERRCERLGGAVGLPVDGCTSLESTARRMSDLPLYRRGPDYLLYDLRPLYEARRRWILEGNPAALRASLAASGRAAA